VPEGKSLVVREIAARGTNTGYSQIGELRNGVTSWKINAEVFNASSSSFAYSSLHGAQFRGGSTVVMTCAPAGASNIQYHIDGYLAD
jgi:hypothetical protein